MIKLCTLFARMSFYRSPSFQKCRTESPRNQTYYGVLAGAGITPSENVKLEGGWALFQQDQIKNVQNNT